MTVVRLRVSLVGPEFSLSTGDTLTTDEGTAARLIADGAAEPVVSVPETAMTQGAPERAVRPRGKARG